MILLLLVACRPDGSSIFTPRDDSPLVFEEVGLEGSWRAVTDLAWLPGTDDFLLADKSGRVARMRLDEDDDEVEAEVVAELVAPDVYDDRDCGLLSVAVDPDFADNGLFWLGQCVSVTDVRIDRYTWQGSAADIVASRSAVLQVGDDRTEYPWHNVGSLVAGPDGSLWIPLGDKVVGANGSDTTTALGSLLRVIPDRTPGGAGYVPHPDNPFVGHPTRDPAIYAWGLRSPWRGSLDGEGRFWVGDVGSTLIEEVNLVTAPGQSFGWPADEGPCQERCDGVTDPVTWWGHQGIDDYQAQDPRVRPTTGRVAWVGPTYTGEQDRYAGELTGRTLFGDYCLGFVRSLQVDGDGAVVRDAHVGHLAYPVAWAEAPDGTLFAATYGSCESDGRAPRSSLVRAVLNE